MREMISPGTRKALTITGSIVSIVALIIIIWLDLDSNFWSDTVILSGIAAGLLTFFLTALFVERWMAKREHERWLPVTRLALTDLLHALADNDESNLHRGHIVARSLQVPDKPSYDDLQTLLHQVVAERADLSRTLARWAQFLASSADVQNLMVEIAVLAQNLDDIRDQVLQVEDAPSDPAGRALLEQEISEYNASTLAVMNEIESLLAAPTD